MNTHLTMPIYQQMLVMLAIPLVIAGLVVWWKLRKLGRQGSTKPLRKRKHKRH